MQVLFSPQFSQNKLEYSFEGEIVIATYKVMEYEQTGTQIVDPPEPAEGEEPQEPIEVPVFDWVVKESHIDTFDFTGLPDGKAESITTSLPVNPIISAERVDGELKLELLNLIGQDATEEERFPQWQEVDTDG